MPRTTGNITYVPLPTTVPAVNSTPEVTRIADDNVYPCRRCQSNALAGDTMRLVSYNPFPHQAKDSPYAGNGPIFIHADECQLYSGSKVPESYRQRTISLRAYDGQHMIVDVALVKGEEVDSKAADMLFGERNVKYVHAHHAAHGCFAFKIERMR